MDKLAFGGGGSGETGDGQTLEAKLQDEIAGDNVNVSGIIISFHNPVWISPDQRLKLSIIILLPI